MKQYRSVLYALTLTILFLLPPCIAWASPSTLAERYRDDGWVLENIDTARDVSYLSVAEKDAILAMNAVRTNPVKFAEDYVKEEMQYYQGNHVVKPGQITMITQEGVRPVKELYNQLKRTAPVPVLRPSKGISRASADHAAEQAKTGGLGHNSSDGSSPFDRMDRYGQWERTAGENISYGYASGHEIVLQLLIDDGVPNRGHRVNILNPAFTVTGVGIDSHPRYGHAGVIGYAGGYKER